MQCEDNSKLRIPLSEVCKTTDIGCVPITSGKPTCTPQPDEIPIAFDPSTTTLWLFSCKTHDWVAFQKFKLDQLAKMNMDNIRNICEVLNIAVWYDSNSAHVQGTVTLGQLADEILNCIQLKTRTLILQNNTLKTWVEGLDALPPYFIKGNNIWFEGGTGTESDPLRVATYDPICQWPTKSQAQVDSANVKHIGACLDGQMSRVPFPPKVCELPSKSEAQVKASPNKSLIACIDGEGAKVPYPKEPCEFPTLSQEQVDGSNAKTLIACVDNQAVKVPYIESDPPICELPLATISQVSNAGDNATLAVCLNGKPSRMPVPSGMFVPEYICVPKVTAKPNSPPDFGTGPFRMGCNSELYVWLCNENRWEGVIPDHNVFRPLDPNDVANIDENLRFAAWYPAGSDECTQNVYVNVKQLIDLIGGNELMKEVMQIVAADAANICKFPATTNDKIAGASIGLCVDGENAKTTVSNFASALSTNSNLISGVTTGVLNSSSLSTKVNEIVKDSVTNNTSGLTNTIIQKVTDSSTLGTKVNQIVKSDINNDTNGLATAISDKVAASGKVQTPICSLSSVNSSAITSAGTNAKVAMCVSGASKQATVSDLGTAIASNQAFLNAVSSGVTSIVNSSICSFANATKTTVNNNWNNVTVPICENGTSKKIGINDFFSVITEKYVPPDDRGCEIPFSQETYTVWGAGGIRDGKSVGRTLEFEGLELQPIGSTNVKMAVWSSSRFEFIRGRGSMVTPTTEVQDGFPVPINDHLGIGQIPMVITNTSTCKAYVEISTSVFMLKHHIDNLDLSITLFAIPTTRTRPSWSLVTTDPDTGESSTNFTDKHAVTSYHVSEPLIYGGSWAQLAGEANYWTSAAVVPSTAINVRPITFMLAPTGSQMSFDVNGQTTTVTDTMTYYLQYYLVFATTAAANNNNGNYVLSTNLPNLAATATATVKKYRGLIV